MYVEIRLSSKKDISVNYCYYLGNNYWYVNVSVNLCSPTVVFQWTSEYYRKTHGKFLNEYEYLTYFFEHLKHFFVVQCVKIGVLKSVC